MRLGPNLKRYLPRRLFARTLLIVLLPLLLAQAVAAWVFYDRHFPTLTVRFAQSVAADVGLLNAQAAMITPAQRASLFAQWQQQTGIAASLTQSGGSTVSADDFQRRTLGGALTSQGLRNFRFGAIDDRTVVLYLPFTADGAQDTELEVRVPQRRLYTPTSTIFVIWMVGAAAVLVTVTLVFMRKQIRPIRRLAEAAEAFGRNVESSADEPSFKPEGAREVRQAAAAFLVMRNRLRRMIEQRTAMLAAISHDLRTPLTRMKLQLALSPRTPDTAAELDALDGDIAEMERMIGEYLAFARGQDTEPAAETDLGALVAALAQQATRLGKPVWWQAPPEPVAARIRRAPLTRAIDNLVANALKFGAAVWITIVPGDYVAEIVVEDDGPGIPLDARESVFQPFFRLHEDADGADIKSGYGPQRSGYGMGLTIARDVARAHGGDVVLDKSARGGLKAILRLPV